MRNFVSHTKNVMAVGFQYTGHMMYSGSEDGSVKIWDLRYIAHSCFFFLSSIYSSMLILI